MKRQHLSSAIALSTLAALTGCGGGGGADEPTQHVDTPPYVPPTPKEPQGFWQGTTTSGKNVSGVVTKEGDYWFTYTAANTQTIEGFYSGRAAITSTTPPNGKITSSNLRDLNFATHAAMAGAVSVPAGKTENYVAKSALTGALDPVSVSASTFSISGAFPVTATIFGSPLTVPFSVNSGSYNSATGTGSWNVSGDVSGMGMGVITFDQTFTLNATTGVGNLDIATNCSGNGIACNGVGPNFNGPINAGGVIAAGVQTWVVTTPQFGSPTFAPTLTQNLLPTITADALNLTYNSAYETAANLTPLVGNYTGTAGIGTAQSLPTATLAIDNTVSPATISGSATMSLGACQYAGTISTHSSGGNVYDVALTVTNCTQASGNFIGVAIYDASNSSAKKITIMAITTSTARDSGVLFVGTQL